MTTDTKPVHPERVYLLPELLDILAAANKPLTSTELSITATTVMRRLVLRTGPLAPANADVMSYNAAHSYYEVTGATVTRLLSNRDDVVVTTNARGSRKLFALKTNVERWAREAETRFRATVAADVRYAVKSFAGGIHVIDTEADVYTYVASFSIKELTLPVAESFAAQVKRALIKQHVAAETI